MRGASAPRPFPAPGKAEAAIRAHCGRVGILSSAPITRISADALDDRGAHPSRPARKLLVHLEGGTRPVPVWAKRVRDPKAAFGKMRAAFDHAASRGLAAPIPEPYFFDAPSGLLFLAVVSGDSLRTRVFRYCLGVEPGRESGGDLEVSLNSIGRWLSRYQESIREETRFDADGLVAQLVAEVGRDPSLSAAQRRAAVRRLEAAGAHWDRLGEARGRLWPHNDFTLRNIMLDATGAFFVLDWDAMEHPQFLPETGGWWDVALFLMNLQSLARFHPAVRLSKLRALSVAFLSGYIDSGASAGACPPEAAQSLLYLFAMRYWYAIGTDRSVAQVYHRRLGWRYARMLRRRLFLAGTPDIVGALPGSG